MSETRPHLSIGEVLSLLQDEFPDITISKIRFLESQGLLNPERTPSGYRKFYDHDVEQLRWVLRQQKENFLPLKVIKDRLAAGQLDSPVSDSGVLDLAPASAGSRAAGDGPSGQSRPMAAPAAPDQASAVAPAPNHGRTSTQVTTSRSTATGGQEREAATTRTAVSAPRSSASAAADDPHRTPASESSGRGADALAPTTGDRAAGRPVATGSAAASATHPEAAMGSSASLSADELCAATGVSALLLGELERYGLVGGRAMGPDTVYDDEAMLICRLAAVMAEAGIEARHLRMFKVAAEREAGLYEQLALPMLRTQRAEARQEAVAQVTALTDTAAELHAALLRRALRSSLGPL